MKKILLLFLFLHISLHSSLQSNSPQSNKERFKSTDSSPEEIASPSFLDSLVENLVSPSTGQLILSETDLITKGVQPLTLTRFYLSPPMQASFHDTRKGDRFYLMHFLQKNCVNWKHFPHLSIERNDGSIKVLTKAGARLEFFEDNKHGKTTLSRPFFGFSNFSYDNVGARYDLRNTQCLIRGRKVELLFPDGSQFTYRPSLRSPSHLLLERETLPNGKSITYQYKHDQISSISTPYSKIFFQSPLHLTTSTGQAVSYQNENRWAKGSFKVDWREKHRYDVLLPPLLQSVTSPFYENETITYNSRHLLSSRTSRGFKFSVDYAPFEKTLRVSELLLENMDPIHLSYQTNQTHILYPNQTSVLYSFNALGFPTAIEHFDESGNLTKKKTYTSTPHGRLTSIEVEGLYRKEFTSDKAGNPIAETFIDLTTHASSTTLRSFSTNHLCLREEKNGKVTSTKYLGQTDLITEKIICDLVKETYDYDEHLNLIEKTIHDLVTGEKQTTHFHRRQSPPHLHMIERIDEPLRTIYLHYDDEANITCEEVYDANHESAYAIDKTYNDKGELLSETNPIGQVAHYQYDEDGYQTLNSPFSEKIKTEKVHDKYGLVLSYTKGGRTTTYQYHNHRLTCETDAFGRVTSYSYPTHNQTIKKFGEHTESFLYDAFERIISKTDANGNTTIFSYNAYNHPIKITHPDHSVETFTYFGDGLLESHTDLNGLTLHYTYDLLGRPTSKVWSKDGAFVANETFTYSGFHLLSHTDKEGSVTTYSYDDYGRKIREERADLVTNFFYDSLSRLAKVEKAAVLTEYKKDLLDRILEEKVGTTITRYTYDEEGNKESISHGESKETFTYDPFGRVTQQTDALGHKTLYTYEDTLSSSRKITTDANGVQTFETSDRYGHLILKEIPNIFREENEYDAVGNLLKRKEFVYQNQHLVNTLTTVFTYTPKNQIASIQRGSQITSYTYFPSGQLQSKRKPDGVTITYSYSPLGFLQSIHASDLSVEESFLHDKQGHLLQSKDIQRVLDPSGNILKETLSNGLTLKKTFDPLSRVTSATYPNQQTATYAYDHNLLSSVTYRGTTYHFLSYDSAGRLLQDELSTYTRDAKGQITKLSTPYFTQQATYDPLGNPTQVDLDTYSYDALSQLTSHNDERYNFNSHHNSQETNDLDELTAIPYDAAGRPLVHNGFSLSYDALDRLVQASDETTTITFTYDGLGRCLTKTVNGLRTNFFYDDYEEIGSNCEQKILSPTHQTLFIELNDTLTIPLYNSANTLKYLIDAHTKEILNQYLFSPFGEVLSSLELVPNPYLFANKRLDKNLTLIFFTKRAYDPLTKRWLTPDPLGPIDTLNLYAYTKNNPLRFIDTFGLSSSDKFPSLDLRPDPFGLLVSNMLTAQKASKTLLYTVGEVEKANKLIIFVNGINTSLLEAKQHASLLSRYGDNAKIQGIYNPTQNLIFDIMEYSNRSKRCSSRCSAVEEFIHECAYQFIEKAEPTATILLICTSAGSTEARNSVGRLPPEIQSRIKIIAVAPSAIVSKEICSGVWNYASRRDPIPKIAQFNTPSLADQLIVLEPHPEATGFDHSFQSPTYRDFLEDHLQNYMSNKGAFK